MTDEKYICTRHWAGTECLSCAMALEQKYEKMLEFIKDIFYYGEFGMNNLKDDAKEFLKEIGELK